MEDAHGCFRAKKYDTLLLHFFSPLSEFHARIVAFSEKRNFCLYLSDALFQYTS